MHMQKVRAGEYEAMVIIKLNQVRTLCHLVIFLTDDEDMAGYWSAFLEYTHEKKRYTVWDGENYPHGIFWNRKADVEAAFRKVIRGKGFGYVPGPGWECLEHL